MAFDQLNKTYSPAGIFTSRDLIDWKSVALALAILFIVSRALRYYNAKNVSSMRFYWTTDVQPVTDFNPFKTMSILLCCLQSVNYLPGITAAFEPLNLPGVLLPTSKFNPGVDFPWNWRFDSEYIRSPHFG